MNKFKNIKIAISTFVIFTIFRLNSVSAAVTFNQGQATSDIKGLLDPIANFLIIISLPATICSIIFSYITWTGKDEEEKEQLPFHKTIKKHIIAFVLCGLAGAILKWFTIS